MKPARLPILVALVAMVVASLLAIRVIAEYDWDPTILASFGEDATEITEYAEAKLGREVVTRPFLGHDGKYFFVQSNDPLVLEPEENIQVIDRPLYRSQRMFYPILAGGAGLFSADVVIWALIVVNVLAMGLGTWAVARLAVELGASAWWGLSFALNIGFMSEQLIDGAGVVAGACAFVAILMYQRSRVAMAVAFLALAVLAREAMMIAAVGCAAWLWWHQRRREAVLSVVVPAAAAALWAIYIRIRIGFESGVSEVQEIGVPFGGIIDAFSEWLTDPVDLVVAVTILMLLVLYTRRVFVTPHMVGWAFVGFVPLALVFTKQVWLNYFDITRAVAPIITSFILLVFVVSRESEDRVPVAADRAL